jgi:peptidoglycan/xylan/chitin deacetylase (PgdA/CDA1 family)
MMVKVKKRNQRNQKEAVVLNGHFKLVVAVLTFLAVQAFLFYVYYSLQITFNGRPAQVRRGETLGQVLDRKYILLKQGDLVSVSGRVLEKQAGKPPLMEANQKKVGSDYVLRSGDSIYVAKGADVEEKVVSLIELMPSPTVYEGEGPFITLATKGQPGLKITTAGEISREVAKEEMIRPPQPAIIRRSQDVPSLVVALTFDDGPDPVYTPQILSVLQSEGAVGTFFVLGKRAERYPELVRQELALGNAIGNHSYSHPDLGRTSQEVIEQELLSTEAVISQIAGHNTKWFRPPKGSVSSLLVSIVAAKGYRMVLWDIDPWDWSKPSPEAIYQRVVTKVKPGAVILLHDGGGDRSQTVSALPMIIELLRSQGYYFVTLDQLPGK